MLTIPAKVLINLKLTILVDVFLDKCISWDQQINDVKEEIGRNTEMVYKLKSHLHINMLDYYDMVHLYIDYRLMT